MTPSTTPPKSTFALRPGHPFGAEIKRILVEQTDRALWQLTTPGLEVDPAVHDARKCFKRIRGVVRLVRDEIGPDSYSELNALFRDAGRALSAIRTSAVLSETLEKVQERYPDAFTEQEMDLLLEKLRSHHQSLQEQVVPQETLFKQVAEEVRHGRARIKRLHLTGDFFPTSDLNRVYSRGRKGLKRCQKDPSVPNFHEWRKRVKYLRYEVRVLTPAWEAVLGCVTEELVVLSELLGLDHDLADLHRTLSEHPELRVLGRESVKTLRLIENYRAELEVQSFSMGSRLYVEKPDAFTGRLRAYWQVWRKEC